MTATPQEILDFWFGTLDEHGQWPKEKSKIWFSGGDEVDSLIAKRFGETHRQACVGELDHWLETREGRLALVILLDQFSRNLHRGTARAFRYDMRAREIAVETIDARLDTTYQHIERTFLYMPLEHSERMSDQLLCLQCMIRNAEDAPEVLSDTMNAYITYAEKHLALIERFGRFPHRNALLGRLPTEEEIAYLEGGGETFGQSMTDK